MSETKQSTRSQKAAQPVTAAEALQLLESAINHCRQAGLSVRAGNVADGLGLIVGGARLDRTEDAARFVLAPSSAESAPALVA